MWKALMLLDIFRRRPLVAGLRLSSDWQHALLGSGPLPAAFVIA